MHGKTTLLFRLAEAAIEHPDGTVRNVLFPVIGERTFEDLAAEYRSTGPAYVKRIHTVIRASYSGHYRRALPLILDALAFRSTNTIHRPVIDAIDLIRHYRGSRQRYFSLEEAPLDGVVRKNMREIVVETDRHGVERVNRINYEIAVLEALRAKLRCKEIWVVGADRFRNPDEDLPQDYADNRAEYYKRLGVPLRYDDFGGRLRKDMASALAALNETLPTNPRVRLSESTHPIVLTPLDAQPDTPRTSSGSRPRSRGAGPRPGSWTSSRRRICVSVSRSAFRRPPRAKRSDTPSCNAACCCACMAWGPTRGSNASPPDDSA